MLLLVYVSLLLVSRCRVVKASPVPESACSDAECDKLPQEEFNNVTPPIGVAIFKNVDRDLESVSDYYPTENEKSEEKERSECLEKGGQWKDIKGVNECLDELALLAESVTNKCSDGECEDEKVNEITTDECGEPECEEVEEEECGVCHSIYMRECTIKMEYSYHPEKVRECINSTNTYDYSGCTPQGYRRKCDTKYKSECSTKWLVREMEEDHPDCRVEKEEHCTDSRCKKVPVMRCRIEKRVVKKSQPETSCHRVPYRECRKEKCQVTKCYDRVVMRQELQPKEECQYRQKRICHGTGDPGDCRKRVNRVCRELDIRCERRVDPAAP